jgi:hypothetical protein
MPKKKTSRAAAAPRKAGKSAKTPAKRVVVRKRTKVTVKKGRKRTKVTVTKGGSTAVQAAPRKAKAGGTSARKPALGRPKVTGDEKLYLLFREDYHARQIFEFLRVETVKELEQYSPQQIVDRLSAPIVETVQRIRRFLAEQNRALASDAAFAAGQKAAHGG